jgi:hypothetical protein
VTVSRRFLALNVPLGLLAGLCAVALIRVALTSLPLPPPPASRPAPPTSAVSAPAVAATAPASSYGVIATKNLFSPTRSEAPAGPVVAAGPKPLLQGVVMDGPKSRAFLEDAAVKRTFGYSVGDTIGGGRLQTIGEDRVTIARPDGLVEVLVQDPAKPKPAAPAVPAAGTAPVAAAPAQPAVVTTPPVVQPATATPAPRAPAAPGLPARASER